MRSPVATASRWRSAAEAEDYGSSRTAVASTGTVATAEEEPYTALFAVPPHLEAHLPENQRVHRVGGFLVVACLGVVSAVGTCRVQLGCWARRHCRALVALYTQRRGV